LVSLIVLVPALGAAESAPSGKAPVAPASGIHQPLPVPAIPGSVATGTAGPILPGVPGLPPCCPPVCCPPGCGPKGCPSPVLFVPVGARIGTKATFLEPSPGAFDTPVTVGLRPGYVYRFKLGGLDKYPKQALYPTLQVIGTLQLPIPL